MKDILTPQEMRSVDKNTEYNHIPTLVLMENAGSQIAHYIVDNFPDKETVSIYSGTGGNGGDGIVVARHLLNYGYTVKLFLLSKPENIKNTDAMTNYKSIEKIAMTDKNLTLKKITDSTQLKPDNSDLIVDAILGTGVRGNIREPTSKAIDVINNSPAITLSVDVPSGLNPDNGNVDDKAVVSNTTLTLHKPKTGLSNEKYIQDLVVLDIGIPRISEEYTGAGDLLKLKQPKFDSHKGQNGSVLIIGSNSDYIGAVVFATNSALTCGIDLAFIVAPEKSSNVIKKYNPEFIVRSTPGDTLSLEGFDVIEDLIDKVDSILIGSGSGLDKKTGQLFNKILETTEKPVVIDADALKLVDKKKITKGNVIVTPHKKEFEELFNEKLPEDLEDKLELTRKLSKEYNLVILLKDVIDIITSVDDYKLNMTGNQGMTKGATGDMLAGLTTAIATKNSLFEAAYIAAYILGSAGDTALEEYGYDYTASDILRLL